MAKKDDELVTKGFLRGEIQEVRRDLSKQMIRLHAKTEGAIGNLRADMKAWNSKMLETMDSYSARVGKVDRAQVIADWRLSKLEKRVDALEPR